MTIQEIEKRIAKINAEVKKAESVEAVENLAEERNKLNAELAEMRKAEEKRSAVEEIEKGAGKVVEKRKLTEMKTEILDSLEYKKAYLKGIKTGDMKEARALLSTNAQSGGTVPVPTYLDVEIRNAWEQANLMQFVKKSNYQGNVKVGFELSASDAAIHAEGAEAPTQETLTFGTVELKAESIKKWITVSDEAIEGTTVDTINYLYRELAQKIAEKAEQELIGKIDACPTASTATAVAVPVVKDNPAVDTIMNAIAQLSSQASDIKIMMNRATKPVFKTLALNAGYAIDVFDGHEDDIVYTDALPAYSSANEDDTYVVVGSLSYGAQANFPNGETMSIKLDDLSLSEQDLVKIVGRQYVGLGVVAPKAFVKITKDVEGA